MAEKQSRDFYAILGVEKTANQGQVKQAYRKQAIKYHPDKNPGNEEAAEKFKALSTAYAVLSDPNKKRQYDLHGDEEIGSLNVEELGTMGRLFGALISKAGIPLPTEITQKVLTAAQHLSKGTTSVPGFDIPIVQTLIWGQEVGGTVERQVGQFFKLNITEEDLKQGVIINCFSNGGDKFKVVFFDRDGQVRIVEESQVKRKKNTEANLIFVPFDRYNMSEGMTPYALLKKMDEDIPPVFMSLDTLEKESRSLTPGEHLFCVYGDNWFQKCSFHLQCSLAISPDDEDVIKIMESEIQLAEKKAHLEEFQPTFLEAKKKFEEVCKVLEQDIKDIDELVKRRDSSYTNFIKKSASKYENLQVSVQDNKSTGLLGSIGKMFGK